MPDDTAERMAAGQAELVSCGDTVQADTRIYANVLKTRSDDVMYRLTLLSAGNVTVDTCGSTFDTRLYLFAGGRYFDRSNELSSNDDHDGQCGTNFGNRGHSAVNAFLEAGEYVISVEGRSTNTEGTFMLRVGCDLVPTENIVEIAVSMPATFSTLVTAVQTAGLVDILSSAGPFTVFAPTNAAFAALPTGTLASLLADPTQLTSVLTYHVVAGRVLAADLTNGQRITTVNGASLYVRITAAAGVQILNDDGTVAVTVTQADVAASNGVIHVIDGVIVPGTAPTQNIVEIASSMPGTFSTLATAVQTAGLVDTLSSAGPFTVFAPTNAAFARLPAGTLNSLLDNSDQLTGILTYHVVAGRLLAGGLSNGQVITTVNGESLTVRIRGGTVQILNNDDSVVATVVQADVLAANGAIHVIDTVLTPGLPALIITNTVPAESSDTSAPCTIDENGCVTDGFGDHDDDERCSIRVEAAGTLIATEFETERNYDYITIGSCRYEGDGEASERSSAECGDLTVGVNVEAGSTFTWRSDGSCVNDGWTICLQPSGGASRTTQPTTTRALVQNIVDIAVSMPATFSTLVAAITAAGEAVTLSSPGPFTVFAPTNAAFTALGQDTINSLLADPTALAGILRCHVVAGQVLAADLSNGQVITTIYGATLTVRISGSAVQILNSDGSVVANVIQADVIASNGVIHVVDQVLVPAAETTAAPAQNIVEIAVSMPATFSTLVTAVETANLVDTLSSAGPFTVFAPTNAAFALVGQNTLASLLADPTALGSVLTAHVVAGQVLAADLSNGQVITTVNGATLTVRISGSAVQILNNDGSIAATVVQADVEASNGVIHVINRVLVPVTETTTLAPVQNIVEIAVSMPATFSTLVSAVETANLVDTLSSPGPFTVFAPTNAAFDLLGQRTMSSLVFNPDQLADILKYHIVAGRVLVSDLSNGQVMTTVNGATLTVRIRGGTVQILNTDGTTTTAVAQADVMASNGVIHAIDRVLVPTTASDITGAADTSTTSVGQGTAGSDSSSNSNDDGGSDGMLLVIVLAVGAVMIVAIIGAVWKVKRSGSRGGTNSGRQAQFDNPLYEAAFQFSGAPTASVDKSGVSANKGIGEHLDNDLNGVDC